MKFTIPSASQEVSLLVILSCFFAMTFTQVRITGFHGSNVAIFLYGLHQQMNGSFGSFWDRPFSQDLKGTLFLFLVLRLNVLNDCLFDTKRSAKPLPFVFVFSFCNNIYLVTAPLMTILTFTWRKNKNNVQEIKEKYNVATFTTN